MKVGASYSTISQDELLLKVAPQYLIENPIDCQFWQRGVNDTYRVRCIDDTYSLRIYRHELRSKDAIEFEIAALNYLKERGANVAYPIVKRDGGFVSELDSPEGLRYAIMTTHANGSKPDYDKTDNARLFGTSVAALHHFSDGFETQHVRDRIEVEHLLDSSLEIIRPFLDKNQENLDFIEDVAVKLRRAVDAIAVKHLDVGFCHGDCHGHNVHDHEGLFTHYDFDCCGMGFRIYELATFKWGCLNYDKGGELWTLFLEGYRSERDIDDINMGLVDTFVVIRHIWWMALIMGNARDFGYYDTRDEFISRNLNHIRKCLKKV